MNRKQLIYLFIGAVGVLLIFVIFLAFQQNSQTTAPKITAAGVTPAPTSGDGSTLPGGTANQATKPTVIPQQNLSAAQTALAFYNATAHGNPLTNGAYKTSPYLSDTFKHTITLGYKNGNIPVFCPENRKPQVTVGKEQQTYYDQGYLTQETLSDPTDGKDLYIVILENDNNIWRVFDITCL